MCAAAANAQTVSQPASIGSNYGVFAGALNTDLRATTGSGVVRISVLGDSLSYCTALTCPTITGISSTLWVNLMRTYLQGKYGNAGSGMIPFRAHVDQNTTNPDLVASLTGGASQGCQINSLFQAGTGFGGDVSGGSCFYVGSAGAIFTLTSTSLNAASFRFIWQQCCNGVGANLKIDATDEGTVMHSPDGTCCTVTSSTVAAPGGLGSHTFTLTTAAVANPGMYMFYAEAITGANGVTIDNLSTGSARAEYYSAINTAQNGAGSSAAPTPTLSAPFVVWTPSITHTYFIIPIGTNDFIQSNVIASGGYLNALIADLMATYNVPASHILVVSPPYEGPFHTNNVQPNDQAAYRRSMESIATNNGVGYLNPCTVDSVWCSFTAANAAGYMLSDVTHMTGTGQTAWWTDIKKALGL